MAYERRAEFRDKLLPGVFILKLSLCLCVCVYVDADMKITALSLRGKPS